jgi:hypothetical protein
VVVLAEGVDTTVAGPTVELPARLSDTARARVQPVTANPSFSVKVAAEPFLARREVFEFLLDHPDFATHVTRALKLARYKIWRTPSGLGIDDGWGTVGTFEMVHAAEGLRLMYARGAYHPRLLPNINGQAVVVIDYGAQPASQGRSLINAAVSGFVKLDSRILAMASKLATPVATAKGEKEARRLVQLFARTTRAIEEDPVGVFDKVRQSPEVPVGDLEQFRRLLNLSAAGPGGPGPLRPERVDPPGARQSLAESREVWPEPDRERRQPGEPHRRGPLVADASTAVRSGRVDEVSPTTKVQ